MTAMGKADLAVETSRKVVKAGLNPILVRSGPTASTHGTLKHQAVYNQFN